MTPLQTARGILLACLLLLLPLARGVAAGPENAGEALLRRVGERYAAARTLSAKFRQEIPLQNVGIVRKASGTVYFGRPLKMRWDYKGPEAQLFLADGRYFYFRPAASTRKRLVISPLPNSSSSGIFPPSPFSSTPRRITCDDPAGRK